MVRLTESNAASSAAQKKSPKHEENDLVAVNLQCSESGVRLQGGRKGAQALVAQPA